MPYSVMKLDNQTQTGGSGNSNALRWLKTPMDGALVIVLLSVILGISLRVCHLRSFNADGFVGPDSARIIRQAKVIAEKGSLSERDEMRAAPLGRSNHHQLTFYPHLIVQIYRTLHLFGVPLSLEQVAVLSPVIFFAFACLAFYALVKESLGQPVALLSVNFAAVLPILTNRTMAGYVDRDALCLFLGLLSYLFYFRSYHSKYLKRRLLFAVASGLTMGVLGLTWQGVAIFSLVIVIVEIVRRFTQQHSRGDFYIYLCWATPFLLALLSVKQTYHDLSQPFAFLAVIPPGVLIVLVIGHLVNSLIASNSLKLALLLAGAVIIGIVAIRISPWQILSNLWENINDPFGRSRLMETIGELRKKGLIDWFFWPGIFFLPIAGGLFGTAVRWTRSLLITPWIVALLFQVIVLGMIFSPLLSGAYTSQSPFLSDAIYAALLAGLVFLAVGIYLWLKRRGKFVCIRLDYETLFLVVYFLVMLIVARSAIRFDFFLAPIELTFGSVAIVWLLQRQVGKNQINRVVSSMGVILLTWQLFALRSEVPVWFLKFYIAFAITLTLGIIAIQFREMAKERLSTKTFARKSLIVWTVALVLVILTGPVQLMLLSGYAKASYDSATAVEPFVNSKLRQGLSWLRTASPQDSVIAASWEWGSAINLIADRRTIVDEEQFEPWVYKMYRHVFVGHAEREALTTLKAHDATHLLITAHDINHIQQISYVGSNQSSDREITLPLFGVVVEQVKTDTGLVVYRYLPHESVSVEWVAPPEIGADVKVLWQIVSIYLQINSSDGHPVLTSVTLELRHQDFMIRQPPERIFFQGKQRTNTNQEDTVPCTLLIRATKDDPFDWSILYLSQAARTSLAIRLYLLDEASDYFTPVYPQPTATSSEYFARVWKIRYPPDLVNTENGIGRKSK